MTPNPSQQRAIESEAPVILCLAGPGAGKTATTVERIRRLVRDGADPAGFVAVTFTNAAAQELQERLGETRLGHVGTLHSLCLRMLQRHGGLIHLAGRLTVLDEEQTAAILERVTCEVNYRGPMKAITESIARGPRAFITATMDPANIVTCRFFKTLRRANLLTFDTVLHYGLQLLQQHGAAVQEWTHLFCDEYQDASDIDAQIYHHLPVGHKFYVGDSDQNIFSFRGANLANILSLQCAPGVETIKLEANYRSDQAICGTANQLISHNRSRIPKATCSVSDEDGLAAVETYDTAELELGGIAREIRSRELLLSRESVAVLVRTNALVEQFSKGLESYGIPVAKRQRQELPHDWKNCRSLLALLNDPENDLLACWYVEHRSNRAEADRIRLEAAAEGVSINHKCLHVPVELEAIQAVEWLGRCGIGAESIAIVKSTWDTLACDVTLADLLLALAETERPSEQTSQGVTVSTIHGAKGREWDTVFLPAFEQQTIPGTRKDLDIEEERRLAFVAITRARHNLLVSWSRSRRPQWGPEIATTPSQFIQEADL